MSRPWDRITCSSRSQRVARLARLTLVFGLLLLPVGSSLAGTAPPAEKEKRGDQGNKLSDAAKETAKEPTQQRTLHADEKKSCECGSSLGIWVSGGGGGPGVVDGPVGSHDAPPGMTGHDLLLMLHAGPVVEAVSLASPNFATATLYGLKVGISGHHRASLDLEFLGGSAPFMAGTGIATRLREPGELAFDASVRYSLTSPYAPVGIAPVAGFRAGWLTWRYQNGIWLERDGDVSLVGDDGIEHYSPYLGLAVTLMRTRHVELGATAITGWRFYGSHTDMGLENDLFGQDRFSELRLEMHFSL